MDYNKIDQLLNQYWEGETSLEEEQFLRDFFQQENIPPHLQSYAPLFQLLTHEKEQGLAGDLQLQTVTQPEVSTSKVRKINWYRTITALAACLLLLLLARPFFQSFQTSHDQLISQEEETYETPEEAYSKAKEVLLLLSAKMNNGTNQASNGMKKIGEASSVLKIVKE